MRIFFVGARVVGHNTLQALLLNGIDVVGALILDDKRKDVTVAHKNFDDLITKHSLNAKTYTTLGKQEYVTWMQELKVDIGLVIGVSNLIPSTLLEIPRLGFIGMHPTLLPLGRGRAPIPWTIIKDLKESGTTLFICDPEADTGKILAQKSYPVHYEDTCETLGKRSDDAVIELLIDALPKYYAGELVPYLQDESKATHWGKRTPDDGVIDWSKSSKEIYNWIRALTHPYPGAFTFYKGEKVMVWRATENVDQRIGEPGEILDVIETGILISTGNGNILVTEFQGVDISNLQRGTKFQI
jgi:methionyl-tRNA formyltransferase